jgi:DNA-binding transcriptional MocR family regulator
MVGALGRSKLIADYHTSLLLQAAVLEFCSAGHYDRHLKRLAAIYRDKSRTLIQALERHFPESVGWTRPEGGYAFWITLPEELSAEALLEESTRAGVLFTPGSNFFARGEGDRYLRLSISKVRKERIAEGIERLGAILARHDRESNEKGRTRALAHEPALHI